MVILPPPVIPPALVRVSPERTSMVPVMPLERTRALVMFCVMRVCRVELAAKVIVEEPKAAALLEESTPALMKVGPAYVLAAVRMVVPVPA